VRGSLGVMPEKRLETRLLLGGMAATGVVASHSLAYLLASPDPHSRAELLEATGHDDFGVVVALALGALVAGLLRFAIGRAWAPTDTSASKLYALTAPRLLTLQLGGFVALEMVERVLMGLPPLHIVAEPAVLIGLMLQVGAALIGAGLLILFAKTLERILSRQGFTGSAGERAALVPAGRLLPARVEVAVGSGTLRGPPVRP
jgi:hypothetical protein